MQTAKILEDDFSIKASVLDLRFAKPLDEELLISLSKQYKKWFVFSDGAKIGGVASVISLLKEREKLDISINSFEYEDEFIPHGATSLMEERLGLTPKQIADSIIKLS